MTESPSHFHQLWDLGYKRLIPIAPPGVPTSPTSWIHRNRAALGKVPGVKGPDGSWSGLKGWSQYTATEEDLAKWEEMGAGVGILGGHGLVGVDIDSLDDRLAGMAEEAATEMLGKAPVRYGRWPKRLLMYRITEPKPYTRVEFRGFGDKTEQVELITEGKQFVAHGIHPGTGKPYGWPEGCPPYESLPRVSPEGLDRYFAYLKEALPEAKMPSHQQHADRAYVNQRSLAGDSATVAAAVRALPNTNAVFPRRADYINMAIAIKAATQDDPNLGLELFLEWCDKWEEGNDPDIARVDYESLKPPFGFGAGWLYSLADRHSNGRFNAVNAWFEPLDETEELNPFAAAKHPEPKANKFTLTHLEEARLTALTQSAEPLIKGLLDQGAMTVLYGESNTGKTFVAMDMAFHIATGLSWWGMRSVRMPVIYVAAEGSVGARKRAAALHHKYGVTASTSDFHFLLSPVDLLHEDTDVKPLIEVIKGLSERVGLVVIDTLSRALAGGDENASTDMGAVVKHLDQLRHATGAHLMVVHHSGKDKARGARGHSLLRAATDTEIEIADGEINVTKQRDLEQIKGCAFKLEPVTLGFDKDGEAVTSCTIKLMSKEAAEREAKALEKPTDGEQDVLDAVAALQACRAETGGGRAGVSPAEVCRLLDELGRKMSPGAVRNSLDRLLKKGHVGSLGYGKWVLNVTKTVCDIQKKDNLSEGAEQPMSQTTSQSIFD